jgi:hypothetical protein
VISSSLLNKVYSPGSLSNTEDGVRFEIVNLLMNIEQVALRRLAVDGDPEPMDRVRLEFCGIGPAARIDAAQPFPLPLNARATILLLGRELPKGAHKIEIWIEARPFGEMQFTVEDTICDNVQSGEEAPLCAPAIGAMPDGDAGEPIHGQVESTESTESQDTLDAFYAVGVRLLTSSMDAYLDAQKKLLNVAIQRAAGEKIVGKRTAEVAQDVVAVLTTSFEELARKSVDNFAAAGVRFLDANGRRALPADVKSR